ncbi:hypothetical protein P43SY_009953 [Pythium insidiosum]|uniref:Non-specific serine/threonine protein kinase n=1 Tax=Pythium insidiosum TaxID=114742 RepID=A0AAD5LZA1_PYTIN|nr:hypothetical protein P43SY_009953 [Pythium insidiosum]
MYKMLASQGEDFILLTKYLNSGKYTTTHIILNPFSDDLNEKEDAIIELPRDVRDGVKNAPIIHLQRGLTKDIDTSDYRAEVDKLRELVEQQRAVAEQMKAEAPAMSAIDPATVNVADKHGITALHTAAAANSVETLKALIAAGADVHAQDQFGQNGLYKAAAANATEAPRELRAAGAHVHARAKSGETPLHAAAYRNAADAAKFLLDAGVPVDRACRTGETPLHMAAFANAAETAKLLIEAGARIDATRKHGYTPLHSAAWKQASEVAKLLIAAGANVHALGREDEAPLHTAAENCSLEVARALIAAGARQGGDTPLHMTLNNSAVDVAKALIAAGATVDATNEIVGGRASAARADYRAKVCVVGPSTWGKTSFIKSFTNGKATLEEIDTRTVGIDLFSWSFDPADNQRYAVTLWDFAGQDEYQSAHSLFFTRRTVYVQCVNLQAYAEALRSSETSDDPETQVTQFVETNVLKSLGVVCAYNPAACFVFVGTKADLVGHDPQVLRTIGDDLMWRLRRSEQSIVDAINRELQAMRSEGQGNGAMKDDVNERMQTLEALRSQRPRFLSNELLVVSSADLTGMQQLRERLQQLIVASDSGFRMPPIYSQLHEHLHQRAREAVNQYRSDGNVGTLVDRTFVSVEALHTELTQARAFQSVSIDALTAMLHVLHDLGDVLWYDKDQDSVLARTVFLSPSVVIDFVRCIVNHTLGKPEHAKTKLEKELFPLIETEGRIRDDMQRVLQAQERMETTIVTGFEQTTKGQEQTRNALMNMFAGATNRRLFPALWTLETEPHAATKTVTLRIRIRSDLTGVCFHEPLCITVGDASVAKYGIKAGLSVFSCVVPDFFGKGVVEAIASVECNKHIERTMAVHNLVGGLRLPTTLAEGSLSLAGFLSDGKLLKRAPAGLRQGL